MLILTLSLVGTFVFGLSGGLDGVRQRLDVVGVVSLAFVVALFGGITRDLMIGVPPAAFRDWRYLAAAAAAGVVSFFFRSSLERVLPGVLFFDALGLALFSTTGAQKASTLGLGTAAAVVLGTITGIGGGVLRDVLLVRVPTVFQSGLYAIPALLGASVVAIADLAGSDSGWYVVVGAGVCFLVRMAGLHFRIDAPMPPNTAAP